MEWGDTDLLVEVDGPVAEGDAVAEAVLARGAPQLPVQPNVLAFGVGVEARRLHADADRRSRRPPLHTCPIVG